MATVTMKELLEAGVHFGHQTRRWNPKMKEYIFGERNGIHIIDLQKTLKMFREAAAYITSIAAEGKTVLFVGTKRQAREAIAEEAVRCGQYYVNSRWLGGTLTNWTTLQKSIQRFKNLEEMEGDGRLEAAPNKEQAKMRRELRHFRENLDGLKNLSGLPDVLFIVDSRNETIAVKEARKLQIPVVAVVDSNCDPDVVDHIIPGNDDALRAIRLFTSKMADAILNGQAQYEQAVMEAAKAADDAVAAEANAEEAAAAEVASPAPAAEGEAFVGASEELADVAEKYDKEEVLPHHMRPAEGAPETSAEASSATGEADGTSAEGTEAAEKATETPAEESATSETA